MDRDKLHDLFKMQNEHGKIYSGHGNYTAEYVHWLENTELLMRNNRPPILYNVDDMSLHDVSENRRRK